MRGGKEEGSVIAVVRKVYQSLHEGKDVESILKITYRVRAESGGHGGPHTADEKMGGLALPNTYFAAQSLCADRSGWFLAVCDCVALG